MLTARETDVVRLLAGGCTYEQIAARLGISVHTVTSHIRNAYRKPSTCIPPRQPSCARCNCACSGAFLHDAG